jgi:four helix bundle protein
VFDSECHGCLRGAGLSVRADELQMRTKRFALQVIRLRRQLPRCDETFIIGRQLLRSATSVAANYRAACRARSRPEFLAKLGIVVEEADETVFWLELLADAGLISRSLLSEVADEASQLLAIFAASQLTVKRSLLAKS